MTTTTEPQAKKDNSDMKAEYINPFLSSTISAFSMMLGCDLERGVPYIRTTKPEHDVSGVIGLSGETTKGIVVLGLNEATALGVTEILLEERPPTINADVTDAVGELTNIIAGGAKAQLGKLNLSIGLPTVVAGKGHHVDFPRHVTPICIPFESQWGMITVEVGLANIAR